MRCHHHLSPILPLFHLRLPPGHPPTLSQPLCFSSQTYLAQLTQGRDLVVEPCTGTSDG